MEKEENKKKQKSEKDERILKVEINLSKLSKYKVPSLPKTLVWDKEEEVSQEYKNMLDMVIGLARYLAVCCNEGPEVNKNVGKRMITAKIILEEFLSHLAINGWLLYGLLFEQSNDIYDSITGHRNIIRHLRKIQNFKMKKEKPQHINTTKEYVS